MILIVGGGQGIGWSAVNRFRAMGTRVTVIDCDFPHLKNQDGCRFFKADVRNAGELHDTFDDLKDEVLDGILYTAGVMSQARLDEVMFDDVERVIDINLIGAMRVLRYGVRLMRDEGSIVLMGSSSSLSGYSGLGAYCASKFGLVGLTQVAAKEYAARGITCNLLCPGALQPSASQMSSLQRDLFMKNAGPEDEYEHMMTSRQPVKRLAYMDDVLVWIDFLMGPRRPSYFTGQCISITGGGIMLK